MRFEWLLQSLGVFVFLSFLFGLSNFIDTFLRLLFFYMLPVAYPLKTSLKPFFFGFQALCFLLFVYQLRNSLKLRNGKFSGLLSLQLSILAVTVSLFLLYQLAFPGKYGVLPYTSLLWLACYIVGLSMTSFWFGSKLEKTEGYQLFSVVFFLIGFAFLVNVFTEIYLLHQTLFRYALPRIVDQVGRFAPSVFMTLALFYTWICLAFRRKTKVSIATFFKFLVVIVAIILPFFLNSYKEGLFNLIIRAIVSWGLGYSGYDWYYTSLYFAAIIIYVFLIMDLSKHLNGSVALTLILLGVVSFPWNGIKVYDFGYSSIPGNLLSLDAIVTGFFMFSVVKK